MSVAVSDKCDDSHEAGEDLVTVQARNRSIQTFDFGRESFPADRVEGVDVTLR